jgi:hypothetical protein
MEGCMSLLHLLAIRNLILAKLGHTDSDVGRRAFRDGLLF